MEKSWNFISRSPWEPCYMDRTYVIRGSKVHIHGEIGQFTCFGL